jgi:hypothetical protein
MTHAPTPPPADDDAMADRLRKEWCETVGGEDWQHLAAIVSSWLAYERDLTRHAIELKLKAERVAALRQAAQCCDVVAERSRPHAAAIDTALFCRDSIRALAVQDFDE